MSDKIHVVMAADGAYRKGLEVAKASMIASCSDPSRLEFHLFGDDEHYKFEYKNETYRLTLRDYKNTESLSECSKEVDSTLANYKCQNEFDVMKIDNAGECGFVGGKYKKISDDEILLILDTAFVRRTREQLEINPDYYYHGLWSGKDTAILRNNLVIDLFPETVEIK